MVWTRVTAEHRPPGPLDLVTVEDALVTGFGQGPLRTESGPQLWIRGAVHSADGRLVPASQRLWNGDPLNPIAADPDVVRVPGPDSGVRRLPGTWLYGGHWAGHFGHFLLELLPTLWPDPAGLPPLAGVLVHRPARGIVRDLRRPLQTPGLTPWQREFISLAGHDPDGLRVVHGRQVRVDRLLVPGRAVNLKRWAAPEAAALWQRVSDAVGARGSERRVYLSRTRFHHESPTAAPGGRAGRARTAAARDAHLDAEFAAAGFAVVHPELLTAREQVAVARGAEVLAGLGGSALHLSAFAAPGTRVLTVGDERTPARPPRSQTIVDAALGHLTAFAPHGDDAVLDGVLADLG